MLIATAAMSSSVWIPSTASSALVCAVSSRVETPVTAAAPAVIAASTFAAPVASF
jgi:hypothetical protein